MTKKFYLFLSLIILLNCVFFLPMVFNLPGFLLDDYYIFYVIDKNPSHFVSFNPGEYYFLFLRPVTYFTFWLDRIVLNLSSFQMKVDALIFHILTIAIFFIFLLRLLEYLRIKTSPYILSIITFIFSLHTVFVWQIVWIAQRNELLMLLFYILACYMVLLYLTKHDKFYLWMFLLFYVLSVSSKQQAMHLPLILLFICIFYKKKLTDEEYKNLFRFSAVGIFIMVIYFILNTILYKDYGGASLVSNIWKKPLSIAATFLIAIAPYEAEMLYTYFLTHKLFAVVLFIILFTLAAAFIYKYRAQSKNAISFAAIFVISFIPSAFAESSLRIIGIQVFLVFTFLALSLTPLVGAPLLWRGVGVRFLLLILLALNIRASLKQFSDEFTLNDFRNDYLHKLDEYIKLNAINSDIFIATAPNSIMLPYEFYYFKTNKFGEYPMAVSPTGYSYYFKNFTSGELKNPADTLASAELNNNIVSVKSNREYISNYINMNIPDFNDFEITEKIPDKIRGYKEIKFKIPDKYSGFDKIYYNGIQWLKLSDPHILKENPKPGITHNLFPLNKGGSKGGCFLCVLNIPLCELCVKPFFNFN